MERRLALKVIPLCRTCFRIPVSGVSAEQARFDSLVNGLATRIDFSGRPMYRSFTPWGWLAPTTGRPHSKPPANHPLRPKSSMDAAAG